MPDVAAAQRGGDGRQTSLLLDGDQGWVDTFR
jgi:hypothetical protein